MELEREVDAEMFVEGVGFANYVVGNAVSSFWKKEMGKSGPQKMSDPFASFL